MPSSPQQPTATVVPVNPVFSLDQAYMWNVDESLQSVMMKKVSKEGPIGLESPLKDIFRFKMPPKISREACQAYFDAQQVTVKDPYSFTDKKSLIGVEVEVENVLRIDPNIFLGEMWQVIDDHSLRNSGREFKTRPIAIEYIERALIRLLSGLNPDIDFSPRTSIHVHQDVRGMELRQVLGLLFTYAVCESLLFKFAGLGRKRSIYCVPIVQTELLDIFRKQDKIIRYLQTIGEWWPKYTALNLNPISTFGTVEYRHLGGTDNLGKILAWIDLISRLKIWAYKVPYETIVARISDLNTNSQYQSFIDDVFGGATTYLDKSDLLNDMEEAVMAVRNCVITNSFHQGLNFDPDSPYGELLGIQSLKKRLPPAQLELYLAFCKRYFPQESAELLYDNIRNRLKDYMQHVGKEGALVLKQIFTETPA